MQFLMKDPEDPSLCLWLRWLSSQTTQEQLLGFSFAMETVFLLYDLFTFHYLWRLKVCKKTKKDISYLGSEEQKTEKNIFFLVDQFNFIPVLVQLQDDMKSFQFFFILNHLRTFHGL